jgi:hypothetical protein
MVVEGLWSTGDSDLVGKTKILGLGSRRLEFLPAWIAGIHELGDDVGHAVVARGAHVLFDPASIYMGRLPLDRLTDGMIIQPTRRAVKVLSPHGSGYGVVPA